MEQYCRVALFCVIERDSLGSGTYVELRPLLSRLFLRIFFLPNCFIRPSFLSLRPSQQWPRLRHYVGLATAHRLLSGRCAKCDIRDGSIRVHPPAVKYKPAWYSPWFAQFHASIILLEVIRGYAPHFTVRFVCLTRASNLLRPISQTKQLRHFV